MHGREGAHVAEVGDVPAAEVCAGEVTAAEMHVAAAMPTTVAAAVTTAMAATASRHGVSGRRQCGRENNDGNSQSEF